MYVDVCKILVKIWGLLFQSSNITIALNIYIDINTATILKGKLYVVTKYLHNGMFDKQSSVIWI